MMTKFGNMRAHAPQFQGRIRRGLERLSPEQRAEVKDRWARHVRACAIANIQPDSMFLIEAVDELLEGRPLEAENVKQVEEEEDISEDTEC